MATAKKAETPAIPADDKPSVEDKSKKLSAADEKELAKLRGEIDKEARAILARMVDLVAKLDRIREIQNRGRGIFARESAVSIRAHEAGEKAIRKIRRIIGSIA